MSHSKSRTTRKTAVSCVAALLTVVLVGISDAGISRFGINSGRITNFASIFVNGREFDIASAAISIDGQVATEANLKLGQTVFVRGTVDDELPVGVADEVTVRTAVQGLISSIDFEDERLDVLGTTIFVDAVTVLVRPAGGNEFEDFGIGDLVEINGLRMSGGNLLATRIEDIAQSSERRITGAVNNLVGTSFRLSELTVDFSNAQLVGFPVGTVVEGANVQAFGSSFGAGGELIAVKLEFLPPVNTQGQELGEFEGFISNFVSPSEFQLGGVQITTNPSTGYVGGGPANLSNDTEVVVRGAFDAAGTLVANEVTILGSRLRVFGQVGSTSASSITVLGVPLLVVAETELRDKTDSDVDPFQVGDIFTGDYVETRSLKNPPHTTPVITARIRREDPEDEVLLQGFVDSVGAQSFQVFGTFVDVAADTEFEDANDEEISSQEFFDAITPGTFVKIEGNETSSTSIEASEIELRIHD